MQEAYRPPCSEYSFCCPNWVPPILTWLGGTLLGGTLLRYPPARSGWGVPYWGIPYLGTPCRVPPQGTPGQGTPWQGTPQLDLAGYPPGVCPMAFWEMLQSIMGYGYPPCGQTDGRTDACQNITFPSYYIRGR